MARKSEGSTAATPRDQRIKLLRDIEAARDSHVVVYITGDRSPTSAQISGDVIRVMLRHLMLLPDRDDKALDLFLYSRGGDVSVPWPLVTMFREFRPEFRVIVPFRAHSAATMICLGADQVAMLPKAELGPIDPSLRKGTSASADTPPLQISAEDVTSFVAFIRERAGMTDQAALTAAVTLLAQQISPLTLGTVNRLYSHIRLVARKLLASRMERPDEERISTIIESLTEKMYSHGHAIGRKEATELGLPVVSPDDPLRAHCWNLFERYEDLLRLNEPMDPEEELRKAGQDRVELTEAPIAVVESQRLCHTFDQTVVLERARNTPANPQINVNLTLGLPAGFDPATLPADAQRILQELVNQAAAAIPGLVSREISRQSPVVGIRLENFGGRWRML